jgi:ADP-ribosylation factor-like protein 2
MRLLTLLCCVQIRQKEKEIRLLILGLDNAGKTTILKKLCNQPTDTIEPTLGFNIQSLEYLGFTLNMWDVGGQRSIRAYWRNYFESTDGLVWVVDGADPLRWEICKQELEALLQQEKLVGASLLIFVNKQDVEGSACLENVAAFFALESDARYEGRHVHLQGCSAMTGEGLVEGIDWIVNDISNRILMLA